MNFFLTLNLADPPCQANGHSCQGDKQADGRSTLLLLLLQTQSPSLIFSSTVKSLLWVSYALPTPFPIDHRYLLPNHPSSNQSLSNTSRYSLGTQQLSRPGEQIRQLNLHHSLLPFKSHPPVSSLTQQQKTSNLLPLPPLTTSPVDPTECPPLTSLSLLYPSPQLWGRQSC